MQGRRVKRLLAGVVAIGCFFAVAGIGLFAYLANQRRWHEGKKVIELWSSYGLHAMDLLLMAAAGVLMLVGMMATVIARR